MERRTMLTDRLEGYLTYDDGVCMVVDGEKISWDEFKEFVEMHEGFFFCLEFKDWLCCGRVKQRTSMPSSHSDGIGASYEAPEKSIARVSASIDRRLLRHVDAPNPGSSLRSVPAVEARRPTT